MPWRMFQEHASEFSLQSEGTGGEDGTFKVNDFGDRKWQAGDHGCDGERSEIHGASGFADSVRGIEQGCSIKPDDDIQEYG